MTTNTEFMDDVGGNEAAIEARGRLLEVAERTWPAPKALRS